MSISIIICTYNRAGLLERALRALARQTIRPEHFEVIVIDDCSEDATATVCDIARRDLPNLRYVCNSTNMGIPGAANRGICVSSGDRLLFTDDDCIAHNNWVECMGKALLSEPIVAGAVASPVSNYIRLCHNIAEFHRFMPGLKGGPVQFIAGANMGIRRSVIEELAGFQNCAMLAPDMEMVLRAQSKGHSIFFEPNAIVTHNPDRTTLASVFRYASKHASETVVYRNQYRSLLRTPFVIRLSALTVLASPLIALKVTLGIYLKNTSLMRFFRTIPLVYLLKVAWCWGAAVGLRKHERRKTEWFASSSSP